MRIRSAIRLLTATVLVAAMCTTTGWAAAAAAPSPTGSISVQSSGRELPADTRFYVDPTSEAAHQAVTEAHIDQLRDEIIRLRERMDGEPSGRGQALSGDQ